MADPREVKEKAAQLFAKGKFAKAAETYEEFCALDRKDHQARLRAGDAWAKAGKKDKASKAYAMAAEGFARDGFLPRAIAASKLVLELDPTHKATQKMLAELYAQKTGGARPKSTPSGLQAAPEISREVSTPAASFEHRADAVELDAPLSAARAARARPAAPSPLNRADALEVPEFEIPLDEVPGPQQASPGDRDDALDIEVDEAPQQTGPAPLESQAIELDLAIGGPVTGEVEIPIEGEALDEGASYELDVVSGEHEIPDAATLELQRDEALRQAEENATAARALVEKALAQRAAGRAPENDSAQRQLETQAAESRARVEQAARDRAALEHQAEAEAAATQARLERVAAERAALEQQAAAEAAAAQVRLEKAAAERAALEQQAAAEAAAAQARLQRAAEERAALERQVEEEAAAARALLEKAAAQRAAIEKQAAEDAAAARALLEKAAAERAAIEKQAAEDAAAARALLEKAAAERAALEQQAAEDAAAARALLEKAAAERAALEQQAAAEAASTRARLEQAASERAALEQQAAQAAARASTEQAAAERVRERQAAEAAAPARAAEKTAPQPPAGDAAFERAAGAAAPPGLQPRRSPPAAPPITSSPSSSRIWLPPAFQGAEATPAQHSATPAVAPSADGLGDLERSLETFAQFDPDAAPRPQTFTELELEGDSLLHSVQATVPASSPSVLTSEPARSAGGGLPRVPLFSDLPPDAFIALFERCPLLRFEDGQLVFEQGDRADAFFVICAGRVRIVRTGEGGERTVLATLEEGNFFGEMALLSEAPRSASVETVGEDTQVLAISSDVLRELSAAHPSVGVALKKFARQRLLSNLMNSAPLFAPFNRADRRALVQKFRSREAKAGELVLAQGKPSDGLYVVLSGEVAVDVSGARVANLREGELFGEMSLLTRSPASATVRATRHTSLLRLPKADFDELILSHPQVLEYVSVLIDERKSRDLRREVADSSRLV